MSKISIIVPIYNVEKYLSKCLDSLVNQSLQDIQIILVNDGSKDNSGKIAKQYAKKHINKIIYVTYMYKIIYKLYYIYDIYTVYIL